MRKLPDLSDPHKEIFAKYIDYMNLKGKKERTIVGEAWNLKPFFTFFDGKPINEVTRENVEEYILYRKGKVGPTTVHNGVISLRSFFKWARENNFSTCEDMFKNIKTKQPKNNLPVDELILAEDVKELIKAANTQRNRAIILFLWDSAVRKGELLNVNVGHVQMDKYGAVVIVKGKTGKRRIRLIDSVPDLQLWLNMHPLRDDPNAPLFITDRKYDGEYRRLDSQTINNILNSIAQKADLKKNIHPHAFRHGRLTDLAKRGFNEMELRIFAGWEKSSAMPATYLHLSGADIEKKILAKNGIIEDDRKEQEEKLRPIDCPRCGKRNPVGAKFCMTCSLVLDSGTAIKFEEDKESMNIESTKAALADPAILQGLAEMIAKLQVK